MKLKCYSCNTNYKIAKIPKNFKSNPIKCKKCGKDLEIPNNESEEQVASNVALKANNSSMGRKKVRGERITDYLRVGTVIVLFTAGLLRYITWSTQVFLKKRKGVVPQTITFFLVILVTLLPIIYAIIDYAIISKTSNVQNILFFTIIAVATIIFSIKHELEGPHFVIVLVLNVIQGFGKSLSR